jgi:hypothetical protein
MNPNSSPIFVVGSPRSGTSILTWCLGQHPNIIPLEESNWLGKLSADLPSTYAMGSGRGQRSQLISLGLTQSDLYDTVGNAVNRAILDRREYLFKYCEMIGLMDRSQFDNAFRIRRHPNDPKCRWVDGTPEYSLFIVGLRRLFPSAKFIHIIRDVHDVVRSMLSFHTLAGWNLVDNEQAAYDYWLRTVRACGDAEQAYGSSVVGRVYYDQLIADPEKSLRKCFAFLDEGFCADATLCVNRRINSSRVANEPHGNDPETDPSLREAAEALSRELLDTADVSISPDSAAREQIEAAFDRRAVYLGRLDQRLHSTVALLAQAERALAAYRPATFYERIREVARGRLPYDARVSIVTKGDNELLRLDGRIVSHFPPGNAGQPGAYPADGPAAVAEMERVRKNGMDYFILPCWAFWWLEFYAELRACLQARATSALMVKNTCAVFGFSGEQLSGASPIAEVIEQVIAHASDSFEETPAADAIQYECNICGASNTRSPREMDRESASCNRCGSTVRFRAVIHHLSEQLLGRSTPLPQFPVRRDLTGIGMSDWEGYAIPLTERLDYRNTYYHQEPRLDIVNLDAKWVGSCDFVISTEVFEHVPPPVEVAFRNLYRLLKPGGVLIFTTPFGSENSTKEHYPDLFDFRIDRSVSPPVLRNLTRDGREQTMTDFVIHGGDGETLEMRQFCESDLLRHLRSAGFEQIVVHPEECRRFGIIWHTPWSMPITARRR